VSLVVELFKAHPGLASRFYKLLAIKLATRLRALNEKRTVKRYSSRISESIDIIDPRGSTSPRNEEDTPSENESNQEIKKKENELNEKFDLPQSEVFITSVECCIRMPMKLFGYLYIFREHICFEANVFGLNNKEVFEIKSISNITSNKGTILNIYNEKGKKFKFFEIVNFQETYNLVNSLWTSAIKVPDETQQPLKLSNRLNKTSNTFTMSAEDWDLLIKGSEIKEYKEGDVIVLQGSYHQKIYQIAKGICKIVINLDGRDKFLVNLQKGDIFGEMTFLEKVQLVHQL